MWWVLTVAGEWFEVLSFCDGGWEIVRSRAMDGTTDLDFVEDADVDFVEWRAPQLHAPPIRSATNSSSDDVAFLVQAA